MQLRHLIFSLICLFGLPSVTVADPYINWDQRLGNTLASRYLDVYPSYKDFNNYVLPSFEKLAADGYDFVYGDNVKRIGSYTDHLRFERSTASGKDFVELAIAVNGQTIVGAPVWRVLSEAEFRTLGTQFFVPYLKIPENPTLTGAVFFDHLRWLAENAYFAALTGYKIEDGRFSVGPFVVDEATGKMELSLYLKRYIEDGRLPKTQKLTIAYLPKESTVLGVAIDPVSDEEAKILSGVFYTNLANESLITFEKDPAFPPQDLRPVQDLAGRISSAVPSLEILEVYQFYIKVRVKAGQVFTPEDLKGLEAIKEFRSIGPNSPVSIAGKTSSAG